MINAKDARVQSQFYNGIISSRNSELQICHIESEIEKAISNGGYRVYLLGPLEIGTRDFLESKGYSVKLNMTTNGYGFYYSQIIISWDKEDL